MKKFLILFVMMLANVAGATTIASCGGFSGFGYYHNAALLSEKDEGWEDEAITGTLTVLKKTSDGKYDIEIVEGTKIISSFRNDGGVVELLRKGETDATFLHYHPGMVVEIYTFWKDKKGRYKADMLQSKGGDGMLIHKSSVMIGNCRSINFSQIEY